MTVEEEALIRVVRALERESIPYMVAGSFASSYHGRPRATHDADIVIDPGPEQLARLVHRLATDGFSVELNPGLDRAYIKRWAAELGVSDLWTEIGGTDP